MAGKAHAEGVPAVREEPGAGGGGAPGGHGEDGVGGAGEVGLHRRVHARRDGDPRGRQPPAHAPGQGHGEDVAPGAPQGDAGVRPGPWPAGRPGPAPPGVPPEECQPRPPAVQDPRAGAGQEAGEAQDQGGLQQGVAALVHGASPARRWGLRRRKAFSPMPLTS